MRWLFRVMSAAVAAGLVGCRLPGRPAAGAGVHGCCPGSGGEDGPVGDDPSGVTGLARRLHGPDGGRGRAVDAGGERLEPGPDRSAHRRPPQPLLAGQAFLRQLRRTGSGRVRSAVHGRPARGVGTAIPTDELRFTYSPDPHDTSWVEWAVQGAPGYESTVPPASGFAHQIVSRWDVWGPGTYTVGCSGNGSLGPVPASVLGAFGVTCGPG